MPRFENKGFNPDKRNRNEQADRTVPEEENYYGFSPVDLNFNNRENSIKNAADKNTVERQGINPCNSSDRTLPDVEPPQRFRSERAEDFRSASSDRNPRVQRERTDRNDRRGKNATPKDKKKKPKINPGIAVLAVFLVIIIAVVGSVSTVMGKVNYLEKEDNGYVSKDSLYSSSSVKNILLLGVDARSDEKAEQTRSDTMMLVSFDTKHKCIKIVSFLRDTWLYIPTLEYEQRLNAACSSGGYQGVVDAIEYNFGVAIDGYAVVDFEMFKTLVDSLGGVEVDVTEEEANEVTSHPARYGNVTLEAGKYKLSGEQALAYCRIRKIDTDFVRTQRQRTVMSAIIDGAKSNPLKLYKMASNSAEYITTDLTKGEITKLMGMAGICITGDMVQAKVPFDNTWEYASIQGNSVISINVEENKQMLIDYIYNMSADEINALEEESE